jgi:predicted ATPase/transcriptional regulator with XRE-family HTH domain
MLACFLSSLRKGRIMIASDESGLRPAPLGFGSLLKRLRAAAGLTQEELAERAGVSARLISNLERGTNHRPRRASIDALAEGLGLGDFDRGRFMALARGRYGTPSMTAIAAPAERPDLPATADRLIGRDADVISISELLTNGAVRLATLTGPGGVGKTRLALAVARNVSCAFPEGTRFVELAPVRDPELVVQAIAYRVGIRPSRGIIDRDTLVAALQQQRLLLVLDNFEHLAAATREVAYLLERCPDLSILATSRSMLRIRGEHVFRVYPLELPQRRDSSSLEELGRIAAVDLFTNRAAAILPGFSLTDDNAAAVAEITIRLDGLPLAIELAAARLNVLSPDSLLARLERRLPLLTGGAQDLPARLQALRATIDWSYELLESDDQELFRTLAVFAGGFTLEAAEAVWCGTSEPAADGRAGVPDAPSEHPVLDGLTSLVEKSLLHVTRKADLEPRFGMLETIREYGLAKLTEHGELTRTKDKQLAWCVALAQQAGPHLMGPEQAFWLARLDGEQGNLRVALTTALEGQNAESAAAICGSIFEYWEVRSRFDEGRRWLDRVMSMDGQISPSVRAKALLGRGVLAFKQGDYDGAVVLNEALSLFRAQQDISGVAYAIASMGRVSMARRDYASAKAKYEEALELFQSLGDEFWAGRMLHNLGLTAYDEGDFQLALTLSERALTLARSGGGADSIAVSLNNLALFAIVCGDFDRAVPLQREALQLWLSIGKTEGIAHCLENLALVAVPRQRSVLAARLFGAAETVRARIGAPGRLNDHQLNQRHIDEIRREIGDAALAREWQTGRAMSMEEAVVFVNDCFDEFALDCFRYSDQRQS